MLTWMFAAYMSSGLLRTVMGALLSRLHLGSYYIPASIIFIYLPFFLFVIISAMKGSQYYSILIFAAVLAIAALIFIITYWIHPEYHEYLVRPVFGAMDAVFRPDFGAVWGFLIIIACRNSKEIFKNFRYAAIAMLVYGVYQYYVFLRTGYWYAYDYLGEWSEQLYNLDFSYLCGFCTCVFIAQFSRSKKLIDLFMMLLSLILMVLGGGRGAFACFAVFLILFYLRAFILLSRRKKVIVLFIIAVAAFVIYISLPAILSSLASVNSRSIQSLLNGTFAEDNGRNRIYTLAKTAIEGVPFWGYGAFGDRPFIAPYYYWGYCHNIVYEMLIDFGWFLGIGFLSAIAIQIIYVYLHAKEYDLAVISILVSANVKLFLSASFWTYAQFWMLLAFLLMKIIEKRKQASAFRRKYNDTSYYRPYNVYN